VKYGCWQFDFICIIPFILKWPYNIYSIRIYVLSIFGMVNGLSISFLNSKISFFVVLFYFFSFLRFPLFSRWLFDCLYLKPFQWVHVKVLAELEILESNAVCYYVTMESNPFVSFTLVGLFCLAVYMLLCFVFRSDYCLRQKNVQMGHIRAVTDAVYLLP
jgi:hypothetical protein